MNTIEAFKAMNKGKICETEGIKYRIKIDILEYLYDEDTCWIKSECLIPALIDLEWKIVKDKNTLSDKIMPIVRDENRQVTVNKPVVFADDVKEAVKELGCIMLNGHFNHVSLGLFMKNRLKEIFGDRLI